MKMTFAIFGGSSPASAIFLWCGGRLPSAYIIGQIGWLTSFNSKCVMELMITFEELWKPKWSGLLLFHTKVKSDDYQIKCVVLTDALLAHAIYILAYDSGWLKLVKSAILGSHNSLVHVHLLPPSHTCAYAHWCCMDDACMSKCIGACMGMFYVCVHFFMHGRLHACKMHAKLQVPNHASNHACTHTRSNAHAHAWAHTHIIHACSHARKHMGWRCTWTKLLFCLKG